MIRLTNGPLARVLHQQLYDRLLKFCALYAPEPLAEPAVQGWLNRLYLDDPALHILCQLDSAGKITEHVVIEVQQAFGHHVVCVHQVEFDKPSEQSLRELNEYVEKLALSQAAVCTLLYVTKGTRALERKYGYRAIRTVMTKLPSVEGEALG